MEKPFVEKPADDPSLKHDQNSAMPYEGEDFHTVFKERRDLKHEYNEKIGKTWAENTNEIHENKKEIKKPIDVEALLTHIKDGTTKDIDLSFMATSDNEAHLEHLIHRLDEKAKDFDIKNPKHRENIRKSFELEKTERVEEKKFADLTKEMKNLDMLEEWSLKREFEISKSRQGGITPTDRFQIAKAASIKEGVDEKREKVQHNPETAVFSRMYELKKYQEGLRDGYAETPSRKVHETWIREQWEQGKAVLLEGPTGTGKTETLIHLTKKLYSTSPEVVRCTERTGPSEIFGKVLLRGDKSGSTDTYFQPGRYTSAVEKAIPVVFDEFNQLPTNIRFQLKELYNRKQGDKITVQEDSGKLYTIPQGFAFGATANMKSEKHKDRFDFDPAELRVFAMRHIDYLPKEELYDLALAKLMDKKGGVPLSKQDALEHLKNLVDSAVEIQDAYDKEIGNHYGMGGTKKPSLEETVLDPGAVLSMLSGFEIASAKGVSFKDFIDKGLSDFVGKRTKDKDRELVIRILTTKGFLHNIPAQDFGIKGLTDKELSPLKGADKKKKADAHKGQGTSFGYLSLKEIATLDPYGLRKEIHKDVANSFMVQAPKKEKAKTSREVVEMIPGLEQQFESRRKILEERVLETLSNGEKGFKDINGQEWPMISMEEVMSRIEARPELKEKIAQGFTRVEIVPFGMSLDTLREKFKAAILDHHTQGRLLATKANPSDVDQKLELDINNPLWTWDGYNDADKNGKLVYYPHKFSETNHGGTTKAEILKEADSAWSIVLLEEMPNIPRSGKGAAVDGRAQLEAGKTPKEYLELLEKNEESYKYERGLAPEDSLMYNISHLDETDQIIDDYRGNGSLAYNLGGWFPPSGVVACSFWFRGGRQVYMGGDVPDNRDDGFGPRVGVRV